jgi:SAM-dependent methyltransferase
MINNAKQKNSTVGIGEALPGTYEKVISLLENLKTQKILDAPTGVGVLAEMLRKKGHNVIGLDIEKNKYRPKDKKIVIADLTHSIPLKDQTFDAVVFVEGIEHLSDPLRVIREIHRVLKKNGYFILTTPNAVNLRSRTKFFIRGELFWFDEIAINRFGHISPQFPFLLEHSISEAGFRILKITGNNRINFINLIAWLAFIPLVLLKKYRMNSLKYFNSQTLIYFCTKR